MGGGGEVVWDSWKYDGKFENMVIGKYKRIFMEIVPLLSHLIN